MSVPRTRALARAVLAACCVAACGGEAAPATQPAPGPTPPVPTAPTGPGTLRVVSDRSGADTVTSWSDRPFVVELRGPDGRPAPGLVVRFEAAVVGDSSRRAEAGVFVCVPGATQCDEQTTPVGARFVAQRTDSLGRASITLRLGTVAGRQWLRLAVPDWGTVDSIGYVVRPGMPARVRFARRDTVITIDGSATMRAATADRFGNPVAELPIYASTSIVVVADASGRVQARAVGNGWVSARIGTAVDSIAVQVVPAGRIAAYLGVGIGDAIMLTRLDGSDLRLLNAGKGSNEGGWPSWAPDGARLAFHAGYDRLQVFVSDTLGATRLLSAPGVAEAHPTWSPDGQWLYVTRLAEAGPRIWRLRADGSGAEPVASLAGRHPAVSPDGRVLAFDDVDGRLTLYRFADARVQQTGISGIGPRWSPDGRRLAVVDEAGRHLVVVDAETGLATVRVTRGGLRSGLTWSPDGKWLLTNVDGTLLLVDAATASSMPLWVGANAYQPAWRPL